MKNIAIKMPKKEKMTAAKIDKKVLGMVDTRATDDDSLILKRQRNTTMATFFGTDQMSAVAYYVSDLVAKGFNDKQIVDVVNEKYEINWNLNKVRVCKALLRKVWRAETACQMEDQIAQELASINTQEREAWEAWEFSKKGIKRKRSRTENSNGEIGENTYDLTEIINEEDTSAGEIKFLQHINELHKEKRKLLGLYAPEKASKNGADKPTAVQFNIVGDSAAGSVGNVMSALLGGGNKAVEQTAEVVEEQAQVIDTATQQAQENTLDIDSFIEELMEDNG